MRLTALPGSPVPDAGSAIIMLGLSLGVLAIASCWMEREPFKPSPDGLAKRLSGHVDASVKKLTTQNAPGGNKYVLSNTPSTRGRQVFLERSMGA